MNQTTVKNERHYALLSPVVSAPRHEKYIILTQPTRADVSWLVDQLSSDIPTALDLETKGNDPADSHSVVVGLGLASRDVVVYINLNEEVKDRDVIYSLIVGWLHQLRIPLLAHNMFFDASYLVRDFPSLDLNWLGCTYALYRLLATEGFPGQTWNLKDAMRDMLGWAESNERPIHEWLVNNGWGKAVTYKGEEVLRPDLGQMWRVPSDILGHYCCQDADATWMLYTYVLEPVLEWFSRVRPYYMEYWLNHIKLLIKQKLSGIAIDVPRLSEYQIKLLTEIKNLELQFIKHPTISPHIKEYNQKIIAEIAGREPVQYTKKGNVSKHWTKWNERLYEAKNTQHFNINSGAQKQWLFYDKLQYPKLLFTESGQPATDKRALLGFGEPGKVLKAQNDKVKEEGYVAACLEHTRNGVLHPSFRSPGTLTGRLGGSGGFNVQQQPSTKGYLSCFMSRPGTVWIDCDFSSLENVVLAELSKDAALWKLYGPNAPACQDSYLFNGSHLPVIGPKILAAGYNPNNPTEEMIARVKKECAQERSISKVITLASNYGAGAGKIAQTLRLSGVDISDQQAAELLESYWLLYAGVREYERELRRQYKNNKGWLFNGIGRPIGVAVNYEKDLVNRCLAEGTLVRVKNKGWVPIEQIEDTDLVWSGNEWNSHEGVVFNGVMEVTNFNGIYCTSNHKFLAKDGNWYESRVFQEGKCSLQQEGFDQLCYSWTDVWQLARRVWDIKKNRFKTMVFLFLPSPFRRKVD